MKKRYIQPDMQVMTLSTRPLMLGGSQSGSTRGDEITTPGVGGGSGSRRYRSFDDDEDEEEDY